MSDDLKAFVAQVSAITAEAASTNWLASSWRPITMLVFVALVCAHWFGLTPKDLPAEQVMELFAMVKVGLGGYATLRTTEKITGMLKGVAVK
jgi:hypothetical protein